MLADIATPLPLQAQRGHTATIAGPVHHRGQAHAMLSSTPVAPPQLDEFLMASEAHLRRADLEALGWTEADIFGPPGTDS